MSYQEQALAIIDRLTDNKSISIRERGTLRRAILLPDRPQGKWIWSPVADDGTMSECCNKCSFSHMFIGGHTAQYNFCPNCGAEMRGAE